MELLHVFNRGVEGRDLFLDSQDYARFVHNLYEFNDTAPASEFIRRDVDLRKPTFGYENELLRYMAGF